MLLAGMDVIIDKISTLEDVRDRETLNLIN